MRNLKKFGAINLVLALFLSLFVNVNFDFSQRFLAEAETLDAGTPVADGTVYASATYGTTTYLGGSFNYLGPYTGTGVPYTIATNTAVSTYPKVNRDVNVVIPDGSGGWYVGGDFTTIGSSSKTNLAHITSSGLVDATFSPEPNYPVQSLLLDGSTLYVGGSFTSIGGQSYSNLAAVNATTGTALSWNPGADSIVYDMELSGSSTLYVVGSFSNVGGSFRSKAGAVDTTTGTATSWNPFVEGIVYSIELDATYAYLGGSFWNVASTSRSGLASVALADAALTTWNPAPNGAVEDLEIESTTLYAGGTFTSIGGETRNRLASFNTGTGTVSSWDPNIAGGASPLVNDIMVAGSTAYIGGSFTTIGTDTRYNVAGVNTSTGAATAFNPIAGGAVRAVAVNGDSTVVYVGGTFKSSGSGTAKRAGVAAINNSTNAILSFDPILTGGSAAATSLAVSSDGSDLYIGGSFSAVDGTARESLALVDTATGNVDTGFDAGINSSSYIYSLLLNGSTLYLGGQFNTVDSTARYNLAAVSSSDGTVTSWDPSVGNAYSGYVYDMVLSGSTLYFGGNFSVVGSDSRTNVAAVDTSTGAATSWNPGANGAYFGYVYEIEISGSTVYIGGNFTTAGGSSRNNIAAIDASGVATSWNPNADGAVQALSIIGSNVYVGGGFSNIGGESRSRVAALGLSTGLASTWDPGANSTVYVASATTGHLFLGGDFTVIDGESLLYFAHYTIVSNSAPTVTVSSLTPRTDGTGIVDVALVVDDADDDTNVTLKAEYKAGTDCSTAGSDPTLDETDANTTSSSTTDPKVENDNAYQVGNSSGYITTASGANTVNFDWLSMTDLSSVDSTVYCMRFTANDGTVDSSVATSTLTIDNAANVPASLSVSAPSTSQVNVAWLANSNPTGTEYFVEDVIRSTSSGWTTDLFWVEPGLTCGTAYSYRVKARNTALVETAFTSSLNVSTLTCTQAGSASTVSLYGGSDDEEEDEDAEEAVVEEVSDDEGEESVDQPVVEEEAEEEEGNNNLEIVTDVVIQNNNDADKFVAEKKIIQAISQVKDSFTDTKRVNWDIVVEAESNAVDNFVAGDVDVELTPQEVKVLESESKVEAFIEEISVGEKKTPEEIREAEEQVEVILENKFDKLRGKELKFGDKQVKIDEETEFYFTFSAKQAEFARSAVELLRENKVVLTTFDSFGESRMSAYMLAKAGAELDDPQATDKYFFGGEEALSKPLEVPKKMVITNVDDKEVADNTLLWIGGEKGKNYKIFTVDKVDPENRDTWVERFVGEGVIDDGNKGTFVMDFEPEDNGKTLFLIVQDDRGVGSVAQVHVNFDAPEQLEGASLSHDLTAIGDPMGGYEGVDAIGDPMGGRGVSQVSDQLYTSVLLAQADNARERELSGGTVESVKYLTGYAKPGTTVIVTWKSLTYSSVVIADASEGYFQVDVPDVLEGGDHEAIVYVYNSGDNIVSSITSLLFGKGRS